MTLGRDQWIEAFVAAILAVLAVSAVWFIVLMLVEP